MKALAILALVVLPCAAQRLHVYSPFTRVAPDGAVVKADQGTAEPRHILSPGFPRGVSTPLRIVVEMDVPVTYHVDVGLNPEDAVGIRLYREAFSGGVPDALEEVKIPYTGTAADFSLPGQKAVTFWLDIQVPANAKTERVKVQPQLFAESGKDWFVYPMEVRIQEPLGKQTGASKAPLPGVNEPADHAAYAPLRVALCGAGKTPAGAADAPLTARMLLRRYAEETLALAPDSARLQAAFLKATGLPSVKGWCANPATPAAGPEWFLRFRDQIYREAGAQ